MIESNFFIKRVNILLYLIFTLVFIYIVSHPVLEAKDSKGYIDAYINRSAVYPIFLWVMRSFFGNVSAIATLIVQATFGIVAVFIFLKSITKIISLSWYFEAILALVLLLPYLSNFPTANYLLSEALSYPLYLFVISRFFLGIGTKQHRYYWQAIALLFLLLLTRNQFLFIVPIGILFLLISESKKQQIIKNIPLLLAFAITPLLTNVADKVYHYMAHDAFVSTPWTGLHILTPALYVASSQDASIFTDSTEKQLFTKLHDSLQQRRLTLETLPKGASPIETYVSRFSTIANATIYNYGIEILSPNGATNERYIVLDRTTKAMAIPLIIQNFKKWSQLYAQNIIHSFGSTKLFLLYLIIVIYCFFMYLKHTTPFWGILAISGVSLLANVALVALGMHTIRRFTFYNDWVLFLIVFILLIKIKQAYPKKLKTNSYVL